MNKVNCPWKLFNDLNLINMLMLEVGCLGVVHIYKEANVRADHLAKIGCDKTAPLVVFSRESSPYLLLDQTISSWVVMMDSYGSTTVCAPCSGVERAFMPFYCCLVFCCYLSFFFPCFFLVGLSPVPCT